MRSFLYCLFFPHPDNNHRARVLHHKSLLLVIGFFVFSSFFFSSGLNPFSNKIKAFADISTNELITFTNQQRVQNGLSGLSDNSELDLAAKRKADDMFAKNYWAHNAPDGTTPWSFIKGAGYNYIYAGENLARGFNSAQDVVNAWMASPDHRANILSPNYKDVGFAVEQGQLGGEQTFLVVEEFGSKSVFVPVVAKPTPIAPAKVKKVLAFNVTPSVVTKPTFSFSSELAIVLAIMFLATLIIDIVLIEKRKIARVAGHSLDHVFFMLTLILVIAIFSVGQIL